MKNNKGFTLIELLAVILILGIIALIAIPTVNNILKESRAGAWKSTASQMTKAAENYYQLQVIKNAPYVMNFKTSASSNTGKFIKMNASGKEFEEVATKLIAGAGITNATESERKTIYDVIQAALSLKGDIPTYTQIDVFTLDGNGAATLAFENQNAYCMTTNKQAFTKADYEGAVANKASTGEPAGAIIEAGANIACLSK
ncbi:MAG: prepilin-type N-terminal cleavage/methylation domain-containing protein [Bacilli bacterium]